ncbi:MAG: Gfo/Idh/MocA family oxidoreductase [Nocardioides sp.]|uniref:Gfo/Idh/MocA family protein n=1 Tax=Nocardioides sp. TaxID=35761 RepID=UPI0039E32A8C
MVGAIVVGTGFGAHTHVEALRRAGADVVALVGRDPDRTADRARQVGVGQAMTSYPAALALPEVEAVVIATPPHTHAGLALQAVEAGKHVVCEKPFTLDYDEARILHEAAEAAGVVHLFGTEFRWGTSQALIARALADGAIGEPRLATFLLQMPLLAGPAAAPPDWFLDPGQGGGWLGAYAPHLIDQVRVSFGDVTGVSAALPTISDRGWTVEDTFSVRFRTASGVDGILQSSAVDGGDPFTATRIVGTKGSLWIEGASVMVADELGRRECPVPEDLVLPAVTPPPQRVGAGAYEQMISSGTEIAPAVRMYEAMLGLIGGRPPSGPAPATFADGRANMAVLDAIRESAADGGRWVRITPDRA